MIRMESVKHACHFPSVYHVASPSGQLLSALYSNLSICLSLSGSGVECVGPSVRAESRYGNLCPAHAQLARLLSSLSRLVSLLPHSDSGEQRTRGQHRNQRERWITSVEQECGAQTMPKPRSQRRFYGERQTCVVFATCGKVYIGRPPRDSGNMKEKESCEKFSKEKRLIGHGGQLRSGLWVE